jgi:hypothetical protein
MQYPSLRFRQLLGHLLVGIICGIGEGPDNMHAHLIRTRGVQHACQNDGAVLAEGEGQVPSSATPSL